MISVKEAKDIIHSSIPEPMVELVPFSNLSGRVLAEDLRTPFAQPRFTNAAMDGFAVRSQDIAGASQENPVVLQLKGTISAGQLPDFRLHGRECAQVMTGAPVPRGSDAVVMVERTSGFESEGSVEIFRAVQRGENVRREGEEISKGEVLLKAGTKIGIGEMGVLATFGISQAQVYKQCRLAVLVTGNELRAVGQPLEAGQIYNSNLPIMAELAIRVGAKVVLEQAVRDDQDELKVFLWKALADSDVVVSCGGISMGRYDYVRDVLLELGVKEYFSTVAQKPGKPFFFGIADQTLLFGLPGNPVSAFICLMEYVWPACEAWMGLQPLPKLQATLTQPFPRDFKKHRFLFGVVWSVGGKLKTKPSAKLGSHMLTSSLGANCILEAEPGDGPIKEGEMIALSLLPWCNLTGA